MTIALQLSSGQTLSLPASLGSATTYVVLEQGGWFEKEWRFVIEHLAEGVVVDIGANLGLYAVPLAARGARVFAYEPAAATRALLEESVRLNRLTSLAPVDVALSNRSGEGFLRLDAGGTEYNSVSQEAAGEPIRLSTLDAEAKRLRWKSVDFVKLDAEGEELNILAGGGAFFDRFSPLVMFEINNAGVPNTGLREAFEAKGYAVYRLLGDGSLLVPWRADEHQDFELNLFAAKPDRARTLADRGLLCLELTDGPVDPAAWRWVLAQPYLAAFGPGREPQPDYALALSALGLWRNRQAPLGLRCSALRFAVATLNRLCAAEPTVWRLATLARAEFELGRQASALGALSAIRGNGRLEPREPFLAPCPRYDALDPAGREDEWFSAAILEQRERLSSHSTAFHPSDPILGDLAASALASDEIRRRLALQLARRGEPAPQALCDKIRAAAEPNAERFTPDDLALLARAL